MTSRWIFWRSERIGLEQAVPDGLTVRNPNRGFYHVYTYDLAAEEAEQDWIWSLQPDEVLALVILDLSACRERALSDRELAKAARIFSLFSGHGMQMILRPLYDRQGQGLLREPEALGIVQTHMRQLLPVIRSYAAHVLTVQGLFIGSWGEMHGSRFLDEESLCTLYGTMEQELGDAVQISVRKPQFQRLFAGEQGGIRTGLYDDAILGSETDMGTFGWIPERKPGIMWTPELELDFIRQESAHVLCGGELLGTDSSWQEMLGRLELMQPTYLNSVHEPGVWQRLGNTFPEGLGMSGLEYIRSHLGYRYVICGVELKGNAGGTEICVTLENRGMACCYDELRLELSVGERRRSVSMDGKTIKSHGRAEVSLPLDFCETMDNGNYPLRLFIRHEKTGLPIFPAQDQSAEDSRRCEMYDRSSSFSEGILLGVLSTVKDATS